MDCAIHKGQAGSTRFAPRALEYMRDEWDEIGDFRTGHWFAQLSQADIDLLFDRLDAVFSAQDVEREVEDDLLLDLMQLAVWLCQGEGMHTEGLSEEDVEHWVGEFELTVWIEQMRRRGLIELAEPVSVLGARESLLSLTGAGVAWVEERERTRPVSTVSH